MLEQHYPGRDEWLYQVCDAREWDEKPILGQTRQASWLVCKASGDEACARYDQEINTSDSWREKVATDLALMLSVPLPPAVLLPRDTRGYVGVANRAVAFHQTLTLWSKAQLKIHGDPAVWKAWVSERYPVETVAFDCWVGNPDRRINYGNVLISEPLDGPPTVVPIDYNLAFGHREARWETGHWDQAGFHKHNFPVPMCVSLSEGQKYRILETCDKIESIDVECLNHVVQRASDFYARETERKLAECTLEGLQFRRERLRGWIEDSLT